MFYTILFFISILFLISIKKEYFTDYVKLYKYFKQREYKDSEYVYTPFNYTRAENNIDINIPLYCETESIDYEPYNIVDIKNSKKKSYYKSLPLRKYRASNFKCQRQYMTCSDNHIQRTPYLKDIITYRN